MFTFMMKAICFVGITLGLMFIYTTLWGGPFVTLFAWLSQYAPPEMHFTYNPINSNCGVGAGGEQDQGGFAPLDPR